MKIKTSVAKQPERVALRADQLVAGELYTVVSPDIQAGTLVVCIPGPRNCDNQVLLLALSEQARKRYDTDALTLVENDTFRYLPSVGVTVTLESEQ